MGRDIVTVLRELSAAGPTSVGAVERAIVKFRASLEPDQIPDAVVFEELAFKFREAHEERADGRYFLPLFTSEGSDGTTVEEPSPRANPVAVVCYDAPNLK